MGKLNSLTDIEIEERGTFVDLFADKLKSNPKAAGALTGLTFEQFAVILIIECDIDLDFVTVSQLYDHFKE